MVVSFAFLLYYHRWLQEIFERRDQSKKQTAFRLRLIFILSLNDKIFFV